MLTVYSAQLQRKLNNMAYLGLDTSNYTTSAALYFPEENKIIHEKKLLPVKEGERGLRQSDAVFHHTVQLSEVVGDLFKNDGYKIESVGASAFPTMAESSYMPCFLVGKNTAEILGHAINKPVYFTSHQIGHIIAALYSAKRLDLLNETFIAFHVSGGTTEALLVEPDDREIISCKVIGKSTDLKAGQAVDRVGVMLNMKFPCGKELDKLSCDSKADFKIKASLNGTNISLSGVENKCKAMLEKGESFCDIAKFCIQYISVSLEKMTEAVISEYGNLPLLYSGGVMSNSYIKNRFSEKFGGIFADGEFSSDNAAGVAIMAYLKENRN